MALQMWSLFRFNEIFEHLSLVCKQDEPITLWQSSSQHLFQLKAQMSGVDEKTCSVVLDHTVSELARLVQEEGLYFHCEIQNIIFKRDKFSVDGCKISFKTPSELMLKEKRRISRFKFKYQDFKDVSFNYEVDHGEDGEPIIKRGSLTMVDLSIAGLGCIGARKQVESLKEGSCVYITQISDQELEVTPLKAIIRSFVASDSKEGVRSGDHGSKNVRLCLEFDQAINEVQYESVQSIVKRTQKKTKGLDIEGFNGLSEIELLRMIKKTGEANPVLAAEIIEQSEDIDRLRYMTAEMKKIFWTEVNKDILAQALRVASKELIYTLLSEVTDNMRNEFLEELDRPKSLSAISKSQKIICEFIHQREREGRFVLSAKSYVKYV